MVNGDVLVVTSFLKDHPGGELAILTFAGKDATKEFNMIHPPGVIPRYAPDVGLGKLVSGGGGDAPHAPRQRSLPRYFDHVRADPDGGEDRGKRQGEIITKARAHKLMSNSSGVVTGLVYERRATFRGTVP